MLVNLKPNVLIFQQKICDLIIECDAGTEKYCALFLVSREMHLFHAGF